MKAHPIGPEGRPAGRADSPFHVPSALHAFGGLVHRHPRFWRWLGRMESRQLADEIRCVQVRKPIYICGLARSGSTLLHEVVASHPGVATHRGKDYPMVFTPYWWRRATAGQKQRPPRERPHRDGVMVTAESPEALEEMLWMAFFPRCHDPHVSNLIGGGESHPEFDSFYDTHLRKLMLAEEASRYAAKANYHVGRILYLIRLYPDARFLIPVRQPAAHIASLRKQHEWFSAGQRSHPSLLCYMRWSGHFEFGLDRRPIHLGDGERVRRIMDLWAVGDEVRGLAMYWDMVHRYLANLIASNDRVRAAVRVVRFEDVCASPLETLRAVLEHCELSDTASIAQRHTGGIRAATTDSSAFTAAELSAIREETDGTAQRWGY